jgi:hypothetical protein
MMVVVAHEPHAWFLVQDGQRLLLDVNCSQGAVSYDFLMALEAGEREAYAMRGRQFLAELARKVQSSMPAAPVGGSPFRDRVLRGRDRDEVDAAARAWLKAHGESC